MAEEYLSSARPQWRKTLASLQQAGIIASVREDERGLRWLYMESANGRAYSRLGQTMTRVGATSSEYGVAGILPSGVAQGLVMPGRGQLVEAALGPGVWVALIPKWGRPSGILFFDVAGHVIGYELWHQPPEPPGQPSWRSQLGVKLYGWVTRFRFVKMPKGEHTYGPGARQRG